MSFLARLLLGPFIKLAANVWCSWQDVKHRDAEPPVVEDIPQRSCRLNATPHRCDDTSLPEVPVGTGERCVHDFYEWWDKEKQV